MGLLVYVVCANATEAEKISNVVLEAKLAACANIIDGMKSLFMWDGKIDQANEVILLFKTTRKMYDGLEKLICEMHSYDMPCILSVPVNMNAKYSEWVESVVAESDQ